MRAPRSCLRAFACRRVLTANAARRAALSGKQQVAMTLVSEADRTLWVVRPPNMRLDGMPVRANEPVVLMHKSTNQALAMSAKFSFRCARLCCTPAD